MIGPIVDGPCLTCYSIDVLNHQNSIRIELDYFTHLQRTETASAHAMQCKNGSRVQF